MDYACSLEEVQRIKEDLLARGDSVYSIQREGEPTEMPLAETVKQQSEQIAKLREMVARLDDELQRERAERMAFYGAVFGR